MYFRVFPSGSAEVEEENSVWDGKKKKKRKGKEIMTWYDESTRETNNSLQTTIVPQLTNTNNSSKLDHHHQFRSIITCPSCGHVIQLLQHQVIFSFSFSTPILIN